MVAKEGAAALRRMQRFRGGWKEKAGAWPAIQQGGDSLATTHSLRACYLFARSDVNAYFAQI